MNRHVHTLNGRMSLRAPQRRALEILARVIDISPPAKDGDTAAALAAIAAEFPTVRDFERDFPSLCFNLATGVGKTRLMGAFIAYLYLQRRIRHFFVLAPNLTIYNKLIADFTPGTPKYVFTGITEFVTAPPVVITGDNYETGIGVRADAQRQTSLFRAGGEDAIHINVFNISKINSDVRASQKGNQPPRIKRLSEYIGESYFEYLSKLPDLVLLMDESHRYRADAGTRAISELKPILGLELTATPFVEGNRGPIPFRNVILNYPLAQAIQDGFVKEPAVATRRDFNPQGHEPEAIETMKLTDGVRLHEQVRTDLAIYASQTGRPRVKPFMLIIARDTQHASELVQRFKSPDFFGGQYAEKVIEVHSGLSGEEKDETVKSLLAVESADEPTEIVVHVNMLKEGWDVTNLYTIVPLRAANARTLIEQSIGRGLRLPFGRRTGEKAVDRLTIVAHDKFQEIVDEANRGDSIIRAIEVVELDANGAPEPSKPVQAAPLIDQVLSGTTPLPAGFQLPLPAGGGSRPPPSPDTLRSPAAQRVIRAAIEVINGKEHVKSMSDLLQPQAQGNIVNEVICMLPAQGDVTLTPMMVEDIVLQTTVYAVTLSIDIPTIVVVPTGEVTVGFDDFDLDVSQIHLRPVQEDILIQHLQTAQQELLTAGGAGMEEPRPENYVVRALLNFGDVHYDDCADLLYKLAGQVVARLRSYLADEAEVRNVLMYYQDRLGEFVHAQMVQHLRQEATGYEAKVTRGFRALKPAMFTLGPNEAARDFRIPVDNRGAIKKMVFNGFKKCLYGLQKFDSDPERRFAVVLENDVDVGKWVKPAKGNFQITYRGGQMYEPDFVVETPYARYIAEVKSKEEIQSPDVQAKARAAALWCHHATEHTRTTDRKPWSYLLIPDSLIRDNMSLAGLAAQTTVVHIPGT
jgi:type III restriction enzyme